MSAGFLLACWNPASSPRPTYPQSRHLTPPSSFKGGSLKLAGERRLLDSMLDGDREYLTAKALRGLLSGGSPNRLAEGGGADSPDSSSSILRARFNDEHEADASYLLTTPAWPLGLRIPYIVQFSQCPRLLLHPTSWPLRAVGPARALQASGPPVDLKPPEDPPGQRAPSPTKCF